MFFYEGFTSLHLGRVKGVNLSNLWDEIGVKVDGMVIGVMRRKLVMGFLKENIHKVLTPFWDDRFHWLGTLGNLDGDSGFVDLFPV